MYALKSSPVVLPTEQSHVWFPFLFIARNNGCDGTMRQHGPNGHRHANGRKLRKACNRLRVDISVTSDGWTKKTATTLGFRKTSERPTVYCSIRRLCGFHDAIKNQHNTTFTTLILHPLCYAYQALSQWPLSCPLTRTKQLRLTTFGSHPR